MKKGAMTHSNQGAATEGRRKQHKTGQRSSRHSRTNSSSSSSSGGGGGAAQRLALLLTAAHRHDGSQQSSGGRPSSNGMQCSKTSPFTSAQGNAMIAARARIAASAAALGSAVPGCSTRGVAVDIQPAVASLLAGDHVDLLLTAHCNLPGTYADELCVQV